MINVTSEYHFAIPLAQVALNTELPPRQKDAGLADTLVGAAGNGVTLTVTGIAELLQVPLTQAA